MKFGITVPNFGAYFDARATARLAADAEQAGWDGFFVWDHVNLVDQDTADPWVLLTAIALATERVRIGPLVTPLPRRRPWVVARQTATLDHLTGGRVVLGVGLGYPPETEYAAFGEDPQAGVRAAKLDEALEVVSRLWSGRPVSFSGTHYTVRDVTFTPAPVQSPRIPVWVGGIWPNRGPFRRAARWDGIVPIGADGLGLAPDAFGEVVHFVRNVRAVSDTLEVVASHITTGGLAADRDAAGEFGRAGATWVLVGAFDIGMLREAVRRGPPA